MWWNLFQALLLSLAFPGGATHVNGPAVNTVPNRPAHFAVQYNPNLMSGLRGNPSHLTVYVDPNGRVWKWYANDRIWK